MRKLVYAVGLIVLAVGLFVTIRTFVFFNPGEIALSVSFWSGIAAQVAGAVIVFFARTRTCPNCLHRFKANDPLCPHCRNVNIFA
jgi:hypothetical protein